MKIIRLALAVLVTFFFADMAHSAPLTFKSRSQSLSATGGGKYKPVETEVTWEASKTAVCKDADYGLVCLRLCR